MVSYLVLRSAQVPRCIDQRRETESATRSYRKACVRGKRAALARVDQPSLPGIEGVLSVYAYSLAYAPLLPFAFAATMAIVLSTSAQKSLKVKEASVQTVASLKSLEFQSGKRLKA